MFSVKQKEIVPAALAVVKDKGKFLLTKRSSKSRFEPGKWGFIGEAMKYGEQPEETLARGLKEEADLTLKKFELIGAESFIFDSKDKERHAVILIYLCEVEGKVKLNHESEDFGWFSLAEMEDMELIKGNEKLVSMLKARI
ncbi:hypothetical protein A3K63_05330 [Candidatus Micrarchaeota archaeon RBG_16_49_10]|nr:MAG: hypothetical protein A3K63_05330 [Candidatus Micrarchaeota archaeon RBG_16_49_10]